MALDPRFVFIFSLDLRQIDKLLGKEIEGVALSLLFILSTGLVTCTPPIDLLVCSIGCSGLVEP